MTDYAGTVTVSYTGILPDLFAEGEGVVASGMLLPDGSFRATEVLAKHDENYMPPELMDMPGTQMPSEKMGAMPGLAAPTDEVDGLPRASSSL